MLKNNFRPKSYSGFSLSKTIGILVVGSLLSVGATAQIAPGYEVGRWHGFKAAAVTYTFDDNTSKQLSVAIPLFDQWGLKTTLFTVTNWGPNWMELQKAHNNGHEVSSHTVSHASLNTLSLAQQEAELQQSQNTIKANITNSGSLTIAYPNCNLGDIPTIQKYYIAGSVCSGEIESSTPSDFYRITSIIAGSQGAVKNAADFNSRVAAAKSSNGWSVFLMHGIDNDGGYSPIASSELSDHLSFMNTNKEDYWVATFAEAIKYIKERNAVSLTETPVNADSLLLSVQDDLDNAIFNVPITIRRQLPDGWQNARVYVNKQGVDSEIKTVGNQSYIEFDVVPDQGTIALANSDRVITGLKGLEENPTIRVEQNPFVGGAKIRSQGPFHYTIYTLDGKRMEAGNGADGVRVGITLSSGAFMLVIRQKDQQYMTKILKTK